MTARRRSSKLLELDITGYALPTHIEGDPFLVYIGGTTERYIATFSTLEKLHAFWAEAVLPPIPKIRQITDGLEFIESVRQAHQQMPNLHLVVDPYRYEDKFRWVEIFMGAIPDPT